MDRRRDRLDAISLEVLRHRLEGIANEMQSTLLRSSFSPIIKEGLDASASLFTVDGETLAQSASIPIHLATLEPAMAAILERFPISSMRRGDAYILNDPFAGGTHLPDVAIVMPVMRKKTPFALVATMAHHGDLGGLTPGSVPPNSTSIFHEGLRIPPVKLADRGTLHDGTLAIMKQNSRLPQALMGDLNAQLAACIRGARRLEHVAEGFSTTKLLSAFQDLLGLSELLTRAALRDIPDGSYRFTDFLDNDGVDAGAPLRIQVEVTVAGSDLIFDMTGTSPQTRGPLNCVPSGALAAARFALRAITGPDIPTNGGCFRPIKLVLPEGSLVNPREPAPVNARTSTIKRITTSMLGAVAGLFPARIGAQGAGSLHVLAFGGYLPSGSPFVVGDLIAGGSGAVEGMDGVDAIDTDATNCLNLPAEAVESVAPIRLIRSELREDSGGPGRWRGGLGITREYEALVDDISVTHRGERHLISPAGAEGGLSGARAESKIVRASGTVEVLVSKCVARLDRGDRLIVSTAGGAGFGNPWLRTEVTHDLESGKISAGALPAYQRARSGHGNQKAE